MTTGETWRMMRLTVLIGVGIAVAAIAGLGPVVWSATHPHHVDTQAPMLTGWDDTRVQRHEGEATVPYVTRANAAATSAWAHCDRSRAQTWATAAATHLTDAFDDEGTLLPGEFYCGLCGQHAVMLARILRDNGVDADAYLLNGHTVVQFTDNEATYAVDPDIGVPPFRTDHRNLAAAVHAAYADYATYQDTGGQPFPGNTADTAVDLYTTPRGDGRYDRSFYDATVDKQAAWINVVRGGRWILFAASLTVTALAVRAAKPPQQPSTEPPQKR